MVLSRALVVAIAAAGCGQSLFDNNGGPTGDGGNNGGGDGGMVPSSCPANCLGDAAADFDGTAGGTGNRWRFVDDNRNRTWTAMSPGSGGLVGADPANQIAKCSDTTEPSCAALPGALLVSTAGASSGADPAIGYTQGTSAQVIQLSLRVHMPASGTDHIVRLYRNSREDVLFSGTATAGLTIEQAITVDALPGDRFYVAFSPAAAGAANIGVHVYVNATADSFPSKCQLALTFSMASGNNVDNACGVDYTHNDYNAGAMPPALGTGPFAELGMAADITADKYYKGTDVLVRSGDTTTQFWFRHDAFVSTYNAVLFSDEDLDSTGGLAVYLLNQTPPRLGAETCTLATMTTLDFAFADAEYPNDHAWHFVRVVHTNGQVRICVDGARIASYALPAGAMQSTYTPYVARNVIWTPSGAFVDGGIDDVRVFTGALPCE